MVNLKLIKEIKEELRNASSGFPMVGKNLLTKCQELISDYHLPHFLLIDLKERLEKIPEGYYNQELAHLICQKLLEKEKELELLKEQSSIRQKLLRKMMKGLEIICIETTPPEAGMERLRKDLSDDYKTLLFCYFPYPLLIDLKQRLEKVCLDEEPAYNIELANLICQKIEQQIYNGSPRL
jgi:hypothetical protein